MEKKMDELEARKRERREKNKTYRRSRGRVLYAIHNV